MPWCDSPQSLDPLHLSSHFGIPKMDGGVVVPNR